MNKRDTILAAQRRLIRFDGARVFSYGAPSARRAGVRYTGRSGLMLFPRKGGSTF